MVHLKKKLLIMEGYDPAGIALLKQAGATRAAILYKRMLTRFIDQDQIEIAEISGAKPPVIDIDRYAGVCWTGSNLFFSSADEVVQRHVDWCRRFFTAGIPQIGSCWGAQLAAIAAGGKCELNPKGREFGVGRKILLSEAGRNHPMYKDKPQVFDAFESHADIVTQLPPDAKLLASNSFATVQALEVQHERGVFWAFQYHPEYDPAEIGALARVRQYDLVAQGSFGSIDDVAIFTKDMRTLSDDNTRTDLQRKWGVDDDLLDERTRAIEIRNWLEYFFGK